MYATRTVPETGEVLQWETEAEFIEDRNKALKAWQAEAGKLEVIKLSEMNLRKRAVLIGSDPAKNKGTENIELGGNWIAKIVKKINYGFVKTGTKTDTSKVERALERIEEFGEAGVLIAERLVSWKPTLSEGEYAKLTPEMKEIIDGVIVTSDASPTLEIVEKKR